MGAVSVNATVVILLCMFHDIFFRKLKLSYDVDVDSIPEGSAPPNNISSVYLCKTKGLSLQHSVHSETGTL